MPEFSKGNQNPLGFIEFIVGKKKTLMNISNVGKLFKW